MHTREEIRARLEEIRSLCEAPDADVAALLAEVRSLNAELAALDQAAEQRRRIVSEIGSGAGVTVRTFNPEPAAPQTRSFAPDSAEYRSAYLRQLQGQEITGEERAAINAASAVIPTTTMNMIVHRLELNPMLAAIDISYIPGNVSFPVAGTENPANWVSMGTAATDSADTVTYISLSAYMLIKTVEIQANVSAMAIDAFESWLVSQLANKIDTALDAAVFNGTGNNQATGIMKAGVITNVGTFTKTGMTYKDLMGIIASVETKYLPGAKFAMPRALFYKEVLGMTTTDGKPVVVADPQAPANFRILGFPTIIDDNCPADKLAFGDLKEYKLNFAQAPSVTSDTSVGFRSGSTVWRAMAMADGKVADPKALTVYSRASA